MKIRNTIFSLAAALLGLVAIADGAHADYMPDTSELATRTPLMVIRFNRPTVIYEKALYDTMTKTFQIRPSAHFEVVSVARKGDTASEQKMYNNLATKNTGRILQTLKEMGMPESRYIVTNVTGPVRFSEVRIFVH